MQRLEKDFENNLRKDILEYLWRVREMRRIRKGIFVNDNVDSFFGCS